MSTIKINQLAKKPKLKSPIFIEGLPGIGNVGKIAIDFIIEELKAKKFYEISSYTFPNSAFVNEKNLVELPKIELYYKKSNGKGNDLLLLAGDIQPIDEVSSYEFSDKMLEIVQQFKGKDIITLGGIGLMEEPKSPKLYCTGNSAKIVNKYKDKLVSSKVYGVVGPIMGVSGLIVGLAKKHNLEAVSLLAETYAHPLYLGVKGAKQIIKFLNRKLDLSLDMKKLDKEIKEIERSMVKRVEEISEAVKQGTLKKISGKLGETSYIG